ncbi:MAG: DUF2306 domain-containing protein, partial [Acetobacteraceae bacterium]
MPALATRFLFWFLCLGVALVSYRILLLGIETGFPDMLHHLPHAGLFWTHVLAAGLALALMPFQFWQRLRTRRRGLHRWLGRTYGLAVLAGGLSGLYMAFFAKTGAIAGAGFFLLALAWLTTTTIAVLRARAEDIDGHRRWMIRSAALTFAAVTLRLYLPLAMILGLPFDASYTVIAWACWV